MSCDSTNKHFCRIQQRLRVQGCHWGQLTPVTSTQYIPKLQTPKKKVSMGKNYIIYTASRGPGNALSPVRSGTIPNPGFQTQPAETPHTWASPGWESTAMRSLHCSTQCPDTHVSLCLWTLSSVYLICSQPSRSRSSLNGEPILKFFFAQEKY